MAVVSFQAINFPSGSRCCSRRNSHYNGISIIRCGIAEASGEPAPMGQTTKYNDGVFEKVFTTLFARKMSKFERGGSKESGWLDYDYNSFVDVSKRVMEGRSRQQQQQVVREVLLSMLPPGAPVQFRKLFPPTKWAAEFNAAITVPFFHWYLENSGCVGMCVNMCKIPTQDFFTNEFDLPLTMTPNFEDMSCEMVYGQVPPPFEEDPTSKQPCLVDFCSLASPSSSFCHKLKA